MSSPHLYDFRGIPAAAIASILLLLPMGALAAVDIDPGTTASDLAADGGNVLEECPDTATESCTVKINEVGNAVGALVDVTAVGSGTASGEVFTDFTVTGNAEAPLVGSFLSAEVDLHGILSSLGPNATASVNASLEVTDRTAGGVMVGAETIGDQFIENGTVDVSGTSAVVMPLPLTRGHSYRISLIIAAQATGSPGDAAGALSDFVNTASWSDLSVTAGQDPFTPIADLEARVTQVEADVATLSDDLDALEDRVDVVEDDLDALEETVAELREDFENHTHTYLTGRGVGHNNTEATTTLPGEDEPTSEPKPGNSGNAPGRSVDNDQSGGEDDRRRGWRIRARRR